MGTAADAVRDSGRALADVFRNPGLRRVELALGASIVGDSAYLIALLIYAYDQGGPTAVGLLSVVRYAAAAAITPFASTLADRMPRRRVMVGADLLRVVLVAAAAGAVAADGPALAVYALAVVAFMCGAPFRPAQAALLPTLARTPEELTAANVTASTFEAVGFFLGPAVGAVLLAVAAIPEVMAFNALTFLVSALLVMGVHEEARPAPAGGGDEGSEGGFLGEAAEGFRTILADADLRALTVLFTVQCLAAGAAAVLTVSTALDLLGTGRPGVAVLEGSLGLGGLIGGFVALVLARSNRLARNFALGVLLWGVPMLLIAVWPAAAPAAAAMAVIGLGNAVVDVNAYTILQRVVRDEVMGRVFGAIETILIGAIGLGALAAPFLIDVVDVRGALAVVGATVCVAVAATVRRVVLIDVRIAPPPHLELLRGVPLFSPLPEAVLERLAFAAQEVRVAGGTDVFRQGDPGDRFYVIADGTVGILGREFARGECFGEIALLRSVPRTATVTAVSDVLLLALDRDDFVPAVSGHADAFSAADDLVTARLLRG